MTTTAIALLAHLGAALSNGQFSTAYVDECDGGRCWMLDDASDVSVEVPMGVAMQLDPVWFADRALDYPGRTFVHGFIDANGVVSYR